MARWWQGINAAAIAVIALLILPVGWAGGAERGGMRREELLLSVDINGQSTGETALMLRDAAGKLWLDSRDARRWRMVLPRAIPIDAAGTAYYPLDAFAGVSYRVDEATQTLQLVARPGVFEHLTLSALNTAPVEPSRPSTGGFLNYDISVSHDNFGSNSGGLLELNLFGAMGYGVTRYVGRQAQGHYEGTRMDSTWTRDFPSRALSLRLGDGITSAPQGWGGALRFAGVQLASNYTTQPGLVTFATPSIQGEAVLPSVIDLYVNGALRLRRDVPMGPFELRDVPVVNGDGQIRLVVRDPLGREVEIFQPYYASPQLLRRGLQVYSYEVGAIRENYGTRSADYGRAIFTATHRVGLSDASTGELHIAATAQGQTLGVSIVGRLPLMGVASGSVARSQAAGRAGNLLAVTVERQASRLSFGASLQRATREFAHPGLSQAEHLKQSQQIFANLGAGHLGSMGVSFTRRRFYDKTPVDLLTMQYSLTLGSFGHLGFNLARVRADRRDTLLGAVFTRALGSRGSTSLGGESFAAGHAMTAQLQQNLPAGEGLGYRVVERTGTMPYQEGSVAYRSEFGSYAAAGSAIDGARRIEARADGAVALLGPHVFASRVIEDSFAIVEVPENAGVRIYGDNQLMGRSDRKGLLLLPSLRPYQDNLVGIEQADLPIDVRIDAMSLNAVPFARSGLLLRFPVQRQRGAVLRIVFDDGAALPAGSRVRLAGSDEWFPTGTRGEVYVTGLNEHNLIEVEGAGQTCIITADYPVEAGPLPRLGPFTCRPDLPRSGP